MTESITLMRGSIDFDHKTSGMTVKVCDVIAHRDLLAER